MRPSQRWFPRCDATMFILAAIAMLAFGGCGAQDDAVRAAWLEYNEAMHASNIPLARTLMAARLESELDLSQAALAAEMRNALVPSEPTITGIEVSGDSAVIDIAGIVDGQTLKGRISMLREAASWKVAHEDWTVVMDASFPNPGVDLAARYSGGAAARPQQAFEIRAHEGAVTALACTRDGMHVVSIGYDDYHLRIWDAATGELADDVTLEARPTDVAVLANGSAVYVVDADGTITAWPLAWDGFGEGRPLAGLAGQSARIAVDASGQRAVTTSWNQPAKLWNLKTGTLVRDLPKSEKMRGVAFSPVAPAVACGSSENYFAVWNLERLSRPIGAVAKHRIPGVAENSDVCSVAYSPDGRRLATGHMDSSISLWDMETGREMFNWYVPDASTMDVVFSPCGTVLATAQHNGKVLLWETETHKTLGGLKAHQGAALAVAFNPADGVTIVTGGEDGVIRVWR